MITHVASSEENGGHVIVQLRSPNPNEAALQAACRIAQVFDSQIEGILVEQSDALDLAAYPFTCEVSLNGRDVRNLEAERIGHDMRLLAGTMRKQIQCAARASQLPCRFSIAQGDPVKAIADACQNSGPWNVVVLADAIDKQALGHLDQIFKSVGNTTGVVVCGPKTCHMSGPIIIVAEDIERLPGMLKTAERLRSEDNDIILLMIAQTDEELSILEGQMRLALGSEFSKVKLAMSELTRGEPKVLAEVIRRLNGGFLIGRYGGLLLSDDGNTRDLFSVLRCPVLLTP